MSADWWQNFANNFAADLAPLISLFGESPTKQYLSETLTLIDVFIFSMAPIGVLTALVSAIRVAGDPSLRALIGRAQEGAGMAEAELCSSTSRNVCELYTNGGIARVFGRPKILEFVHDWKPDTALNQQDQDTRNEAGIYSFRDYLSLGHWQEKGTILKGLPDNEKGTKSAYLRRDFAPHPNLSLNIGIRKLHWASFYLAAILGFMLQSGVLVFAALVTYKYPSEFRRDDTQIVVPAFPFVCAGTVLLCLGVGMCASIIESSTYERNFKRKKGGSSTLYWIQPGEQVVGDQVFDSFAYSDSDADDQITEYTTSKREIDRGNHTKRYTFVWIATVITIMGFVLQFLGLRTAHSTVSVAQLGAMVTMSAIRALLRTRRLKEKHNLLGDSSTLYLHHELDWFAIKMAQEGETQSAQRLSKRKSNPLWRVTGPGEITSPSVSPGNGASRRSKEISSKAYLKRVKLAQMTGAQTPTFASAIDDPWDDSMIASRAWASKLACAIEGIMSTINIRCTVKDAFRNARFSWSIGCCMITEPGESPSESTVSLEITHETEGTGLHGPWKADRAQLESVFGLWLWSIISEKRRQIDDNEPPNSSIPRTSRLISVERLGLPGSEASLRFWLGNLSTPLRETRLNASKPTFYPGSLWVEQQEGRVHKQVSEEIQNEQKPTARKFFGSTLIPTNTIFNVDEEPFRALHMPSANSLEMMCVQELFTIFFDSVVAQVDEIRGDTEIVEGPHRFYVANSTLSEMIRNFTSSGIGNHDDAITCMVPVLHSAQKLNYSSAFAAARAAGELYRDEKKWTKAEKVLLPALSAALQDFESLKVIPLPGDTERTSEIFFCLISLCELYRFAILDGKRDRLFGLRGFISLYNLWAKYGEVPKDLLLYRSVALRLCSHEKDDREIIHAVRQLQEQSEQPGVEIEIEIFHEALYNGNLGGTLCSFGLDYFRLGHLGLSRDVLPDMQRPLLVTAAKHGWYPVMRTLQHLRVDTRTVNHNGLNYLHYAAKTCNEQIFKALVGDDMDLLQHKDEYGRTPLHLAAEAGRTDVVELLARHFSVEVSTRDQFMRSPLDNAILSNHLDTFALLSDLEKERNAEAPPRDGWELETKRLFQAACCGSTQVVLELLTTIIDSNSFERLHPIRKKLLKCKTDLATNDGDSSQKFVTILELLAENAYHTDTWQIEGKSALFLAAEADKSDLVTYSLQKCAKASILSKDNRGRTCLHHAVISQSESAVEALIESIYSSDLNVNDKHNMKPFDYALKKRSFSIASVLLRNDPRGQNLILPGTAIAEESGSIYFQGTDSRIRQVASYLSPRGPILSVAPHVPARAYTPLAVLNRGQEHQIFYVSKDNILSDLLYDHLGNWVEGSFYKNAIRVHSRSSLAAFVSGGRSYVYYQDERSYIREINLGNPLEESDVHFPVVGSAAKGSAIAVLPSKYDQTLFFQNGYFEIEWTRVPKDSLAHNSPPEISFRLKFIPLTPLAIWAQGDKVLHCDSEGHICLSNKWNHYRDVEKPWNIETVDGSPNRLAVDQTSGKLIYQSNSGDIRGAGIDDQDLVGNMLVASTQTSRANCLDKIHVLRDEHSSQNISGSSLTPVNIRKDGYMEKILGRTGTPIDYETYRIEEVERQLKATKNSIADFSFRF